MLKKNIRVVVFAFVIVLMMSITAFANHEPMTQFEPFSEWSKEIGYKYKLVSLESPKRNVLRWEVANIIAELSSEKNKESKDYINFNDLENLSDEVRDKISYIASLGIINGYADNTFKPFNTITRAEFVVMLKRCGLLDSNPNYKEELFSDVESHWAKEEIYMAVAQGIVNGKADNKFCPEDNITIEEILVILDRFVKTDSIFSNQVITSMTNTFNVREYLDEEKYIVEVIGKDLNWVQEELEIYKYSLCEYEYKDVSSLITLEDALVWRYYYDAGASSIESFSVARNLSEDSREMILKRKNRYDIPDGNGGRNIGYYFGLENENVDYTRPVTLNEFLLPLYNYKTVDVSNVKVDYSNFNEFSSEEQIAIKRMVYWGILPNSKHAFPGNKYMTKAILNYITAKINSLEDIFIYSHYFMERKTYSVDKNRNNWPSNYDDYPFIARPIENEAYEIPFRNGDNEFSRTPVENYYTGRGSYSRVKSNSTKYFNTLLNIDCDTISNENFTDILQDLYILPQSETAFNNYIQYVKDNKIKLSGSVESLLPIFYYDGKTQYYRLRVKINFKVLNSETDKNLILGDLNFKNSFDLTTNTYGKDIIYDGKEFELYLEMPFSKFGLNTIRTSYMFNLLQTQSLIKKGNIYVAN